MALESKPLFHPEVLRRQVPAFIYVYFYELGVRLLKPGGRLSFIVTNKWMKAGYGEPLRRFFSEKAWVRSVVDFGHAKPPRPACPSAQPGRPEQGEGRFGGFLRDRRNCRRMGPRSLLSFYGSRMLTPCADGDRKHYSLRRVALSTCGRQEEADPSHSGLEVRLNDRWVGPGVRVGNSRKQREGPGPRPARVQKSACFL